MGWAALSAVNSMVPKRMVSLKGRGLEQGGPWAWMKIWVISDQSMVLK